MHSSNLTPATIRACAVDRRKLADLIGTAGVLLAGGRISECREYLAEAHLEALILEQALQPMSRPPAV